MKRIRAVPLAILTSAVMAISLPAFATGDCANGKAIYNKQVSGQPISCSQSSCHGSGVNKNNIQNAAGNPGLIDQYLDTQNEMAGLRSTLNLSESDIDDLATWIFYAPSCPVAAPVLQAAPAPVAFASTTVGATSATTAVTITNAGAAAATGVTFANSNAAEFLVSGNTCTATINAGASCSLNIAFKPSAAGARSGTLTVNRSGGAGVSIGMSGTGAATVTPGQLSMSSTLGFGGQTIGTTSSASTITVSNIGGTAVAVSSVTSSNPSEFTIVSSSCSTVNAGAGCSISVTFKPSASGARGATITVVSNGTGSPQAITATGTGMTTVVTGQLSMTTSVSAGSQSVGTTSAANSVSISNVGGAAVTVSSINSSNPSEFTVTASTCSTVAAGGGCTFSFTFKPGAAGARTGTFTVTSTGTSSPQSISVTGTGTTGTTPAVVTVVEYYDAGFDHYFITGVASDIAALDGGAFGGVWVRTGYTFNAYAAPGANTVPVCRFFSTAFAPKSSHFYTPYAAECTSLKSDPSWEYEDSNMLMAMPDTSGNCGSGFLPVYRFYNNFVGGAPNHRYTTDLGVKATMLAKGYTQEGPLPGLAFMCSPQ
jgi:Abnormal spindle-like microcephaly-assoc'd, ASPM-SPD-2-Hydin/Repeat of unknown function (DUF5648)